MTPTQDLFIEVLVARHRLGEQVWTFGTAHRRTASSLAQEGLVNWKHGNVEHTILAWLTDEGKKKFMSFDYRPPILDSRVEAVRMIGFLR